MPPYSLGSLRVCLWIGMYLTMVLIGNGCVLIMYRRWAILQGQKKEWGVGGCNFAPRKKWAPKGSVANFCLSRREVWYSGNVWDIGGGKGAPALCIFGLGARGLEWECGGYRGSGKVGPRRMYFWATAHVIGKAPSYVFLGGPFPQKERVALRATLRPVSLRLSSVLVVLSVK